MMNQKTGAPLNIEKSDDGLAIVTFNVTHIMGDQMAMAVATQLDQVLANQPKKIILDFSGLEIINSAGVGKIASVHKEMTKRGGKLVLCGMGRQINQIFTFTRLNTILKIVPTRAEAEVI